MGRLQEIEKSLISINQATFQNLCDSFLALRNPNYSTFARTGSQSGKQKTVKGTPDSLFRLPNGNYIFVEYSTNISAGVKKLEDDIKKCIDKNKTGIPLNQISEIILCVNFNLSTTNIQSLNNLLKKKHINLTIYTLDSLGLEIYLHHRDLANEYLGLQLDTGQIVSIDKFIDEYNKASKGIATPLNNTFLNREEELLELKQHILQNDFIILTGAPGVGKTKFALEGIKIFLSENISYGAYCVSYKHYTLLEDLYQYFDSDKDYILFVDDANRIDAFNQITGFYKSSRKGKFKVIITVRNYAFRDIGILCQEFSPQRIDLAKFSDEQIVEIIKASPFNIINLNYLKKIIRIGNGNPRLAIMTALIAKAEQNINSLHDVSELFEKYFTTFVADNKEFENNFNIKCLGIISFFYALPYKNKDITSSILDSFGIEYSAFIDAVDRLEKLELIEIQFEFIKIPEQNLSTFFFYKAFIKDNLLSFETLLNKYFENNTSRFKESVIPANNTLGSLTVMEKLKPSLQNYWMKIKSYEKKAFEFLATFWLYLPEETLEFVYKINQDLSETKTNSYNVTYEDNSFTYNKNSVIELIGEFFRFQFKLREALQLAFEYSRKAPEHLPELIHKIRESMILDYEDEQTDFIRQKILFQILFEGLNAKDKLLSIVFYELAKTFLGFRFQHTEGGRNFSFRIYQYAVPNKPIVQVFRKNIWDAIQENFPIYPDLSLELLESYLLILPDASKDLMQYEVSIIVDIINEHFSPKIFEHCKNVQVLIKCFKRRKISHSSFATFLNKFRNETYETFLKIELDLTDDKEMHKIDDNIEFLKFKEAEIRSSFIFKEINQFKEFHNTFVYLKRLTKKDWCYNYVIDYIIDENLKKSFDFGIETLKFIIEKNNEINYIPGVTFFNHLKVAWKAEAIWSLIEQKDFNFKPFWEISFYENLEDSLFTLKYMQSLLKTLSSMNEPYTIHYERIKRFSSLDQNLFNNILNIIVNKNEDVGMKLQVSMDFFVEHFNQLGEDIELVKKAYMQQDKIQNYFDFEGKGLLNILRSDSNFLITYIESLYSEKLYNLSVNRKRLGFVWELPGIEDIMMKVFDLIIKKENYYGISEHFCNTFFKNLSLEHIEKASQYLLNYTRINYLSHIKMNIVIDIARHSMRSMFEDILIIFLSLTQDKEVFSKILWRGNGSSSSSVDIFLGDIEATEWRNVLSIVEKSNAGINLIPIKRYINEQIGESLKQADLERQHRFLEFY